MYTEFFDKHNVPKKFFFDSGASSNFIDRDMLKFFEHVMIDTVSSEIVFADGSVQCTEGTAKLKLNLPSGDSMKILFKVVPRTLNNGYLSNSFLTSYDILNSEKRLRHIRTGSTIPFTIEHLSSHQENVDFALTLTDPLDHNMTSTQKSKDFVKVNVNRSKNLSSHKISLIDEPSDRFRNSRFETQQYRNNAMSPDPLRDK